MPSDSLTNRPIFASEEFETITPTRPPLSTVALASFVLGLLSIGVTYSYTLLLLPILAIATGLAALWMLSRDEGLRGWWFAAVGVALAILFSAWAITAIRLRDQRLYLTAAEFATHVLKLLDEGKRLEVFELTLPEDRRQLPNTDLAKHYENPGRESQERMQMFFSDPSVQGILNRSGKADWRFSAGRGVNVLSQSELQVAVEMADHAQSPAPKVVVRLTRLRLPDDANRKPTASWTLSGVGR